ncbi:MAG: metal ABC transporter ATP-binding protein [Halothiobacillaceae bacterium]
MNEALQVTDLAVAYGGRTVLAVDRLSLPVGHRIAVLGPNGAGKSTLLKACLGLIPRQSGQVRFFGQPMKSVLQRIAYVPQRSEVDWDYPVTVREVVRMGRYGRLGLFRRMNRNDRRVADEAMARLEIQDLADRHIGMLSGGQQQRCFLARALAQQADLYLLDEPFAGVDTRTEAAIAELFRHLTESGRTVVSVHHDFNTVSDYFDQALLLNGRVLGNGPVGEVLSDERVARAFDGMVLRKATHG